MQWNRRRSESPFSLTVVTASSISFFDAMPVDIKIGLFFLAIYLIRGKSTISNEAIIDQELSSDFPIPSNIDISKNKKAFNLPELTSFSDGINETIDYLKYGIQNNLLPSSFIDG